MNNEKYIMINQNFINRHLKRKSIVSFLLYPFSLIYCLIVVGRRKLYTAFPSLSYRSKIKIISVGNITTGGTGKTPFTLYLANHLIEKGKKIAIVLRGYKSGQEDKNILIAPPAPSGQSSTAPPAPSGEGRGGGLPHSLGDEATQYTQNLPDTPICIGKNRVKSIKILEENYPDLDYIIMDDAFQHLEVKQDIKFILFNAQNPIGNGFCLPAGLLREPLSALKQANYLIFNSPVETASNFYIRLSTFQKPILSGHYTISAIKDLAGNTIDIQNLKDKKLTLLSGIGNPQSFEQTIINAGLTFNHHITQNDHFHYTQEYIDNLSTSETALPLGKTPQTALPLGRDRGGLPHQTFDFILTTEKDYTKLKTLKINLPILVVYIKFTLQSDKPLTLNPYDFASPP